ncbi:MAG: HAD-IA family hydrolase [Candidatus Eisenbacteria bacterium]
MVRGVFFDAGNTVAFPDYSIYVRILESLGRSAVVADVVDAEARARSAFDRAVAESDGGDVHGFWPVYYTPFYERLGLSGDLVPRAIEMTRQANDELLGIWAVPVEGIDETMAALRSRGMVVGCVSNSDGRVEERLEAMGIRDHFEFVIDSHIVGVSKPNPHIFELALEAGGLAAEETAYVGDYYAVDVVGARGVGMRPVLFDPVGAYGDVDCDVMTAFPDIVELVDRWNRS